MRELSSVVQRHEHLLTSWSCVCHAILRRPCAQKPEHECNELGRKSAACLSVIGVTGISCEDELKDYYACLQTAREKRRDKGMFSGSGPD